MKRIFIVAMTLISVFMLMFSGIASALTSQQLAKELKSVEDLSFNQFVDSLISVSEEDIPDGVVPVRYDSYEDAFAAIKNQHQQCNTQINPAVNAAAAGQVTHSYGSVNVTLYADVEVNYAPQFTNIRSINSYIDWWVLGTQWEQTDYDCDISGNAIICSGTVYGIKYQYLLFDTGYQLFPSSEQYDFLFESFEFI